MVSNERMVSQPSTVLSNSPECYYADDYRLDDASSHEYDGEVVLHKDFQQEAPSFGNISVVHSNDVHFGTKTHYHGPVTNNVTIKQFMYANGKVHADNDISDDDNNSAIRKELVLDPSVIAAAGLDNPSFLMDANGKTFKEHPSPEIVQKTSTKGLLSLRNYSRKNIVILVSLLATFLISLAILMIVLLIKHNTTGNTNHSSKPIIDSNEQETNIPIDAPLGSNETLTLPGKLKIIKRQEWVAQPPVKPAEVLVTPVPYVIIHHTATENCTSQAQCVFHVRFIQTFHIESRNWWDIGYNFLVGGNGEAYEGRGWTAQGAHLYGYNSKSIGIALIGTFNTIKPPARQILACKQLIQQGVENGYLRKDYKVLAARQLSTTQSPGTILYEDIKTWPHWAEKP